jgi:mono/diheme cytochrome c family protein
MHTMKRNHLSAVAAALLLALVSAKAANLDPSKLPPASNKKGVTYATEIKPIFNASCVRCHGANNPKAGLRLDSLEGVLKGSKGGAYSVVNPGDSAGSQLVVSVARIDDPRYFMPPAGNRQGLAPLSKAQVGLIRAWIDQGAK